jgi:hypothetical protein
MLFVMAERWLAIASFLGALVAVASCTPSSDEALSTPATAAVAPPRTFDLDAENEPLESVVPILATAAALPVVIDPGAQRYARCARITVMSPAPRPVSELVTLVGEAVRPSGFELVTRPEGLVLRHDGTTVPPGCAERPLLPSMPILPLPGDDGLGAAERTPPTSDDLASTVREVSDGEYLVVRERIDALVADQNALMRSARIIPHEENGRVVGIKVFGVRRGTLLGALGIMNGDTIRTINGRSIADPESALETYAALRGATRVEVELERRGERRTHVYRIVETLPRSPAAAARPPAESGGRPESR